MRIGVSQERSVEIPQRAGVRWLRTNAVERQIEEDDVRRAVVVLQLAFRGEELCRIARRASVVRPVGREDEHLGV
jgi:hypothetical protein